MSIAENVARIRAEIERAALDAGRDPSTIQLCAAFSVFVPIHSYGNVCSK